MSADTPAYVKSVGRFAPVSSRSLEECERHYVEVHTRFARRVLRDMEHVVTYHTARAVAQYDVGGGWGGRPDAWRFVLLRFLPGRTLGFPPDVQETVAQDHRNFLRELRSCLVDEEVLVDRRCGQTCHEHYLFEYDRRLDASASEATARLAGIAAGVAAVAGSADGLRLAVLDRVLGEGATESIDEPGQRPLGRALPETTKVAYLEFAFDQREWAEEWFARRDVRDLLRDRWFAVAAGYRVALDCGVDKRLPDGVTQVASAPGAARP